MTEATAILILCAMLGGEAESRQGYAIDDGNFHVRVDCETTDTVIEVGLDGKRSSMDSLHQALFAAHLTGKTPRIILIDRDGVEDRDEYQIRLVAGDLGVEFETRSADALLRWQMTAPFRDRAAAPLPLPGL